MREERREEREERRENRVESRLMREHSVEGRDKEDATEVCVRSFLYSFILTSGVGCYGGGRNPRGLAKPRSAVRTLLRTAALLSQLDRVVEREER